ncbi:MAG: hypothetical protein V2J55_15455 [Candidatus Competibacteraceae bacterium]|jgi:cold shock CspA family protein|nr:hypothetical protein [Candidatus Competibacteraceae bacterium]
MVKLKLKCFCFFLVFQLFSVVFAAELVSVNSAGTASGNGDSFFALMSADGRFVVFVSTATDLTVTTDTNQTYDIFVHDREAGTTELVSVNRDGTDSGNGESYPAQISADGRFVSFSSLASDLTATADTNGTKDVFLHDREAGTTELVSVNRDGTDSGNGFLSGHQRISADGRFVVFVSTGTDLTTTADNNGAVDVFLYDRETDTTELVSVNRDGTDSGNDSSYLPYISPDGRFVVFDSTASDLTTTADNNGRVDVFVHDRETGTTELVSVNRDGTDSGNFSSYAPIFSADGRFVAFFSLANDLTDTVGTLFSSDVFLRDREAGTTELVSTNSAGTASGNGNSYPFASFIPDGRLVFFRSDASDLTATTDTNQTVDIFVRDREAGTTELISTNSAGTASGNGESSFAQISADGRFVAFSSLASDLTATADTNGTEDIFVHDREAATTALLSINSDGTDSGNGSSRNPQISADGRFVFFESDASDLDPLDTDTDLDIFVSVNPLIDQGKQSNFSVGVFRNGTWYLDNGNFQWDGCGSFPSQDLCFVGAFGALGDLPVVGDWTGNGTSAVGVFRNGTWYLDNGNFTWDGCGSFPNQDLCLVNTFGAPSDTPVAGDWTGNGSSAIGVFRNGTWYLDNGNFNWDGCGSFPSQDLCFVGAFGAPGDLPVVGDWTGNGTSAVGVFRNGTWYLDNGNFQWDGCGSFPNQDLCLVNTFGAPSDIPVAGDWTGNGSSAVGVFRNGTWYLDNGNFQWDGCGSFPNQDLCLINTFGAPGDLPVAGAWGS